jgi:hypothetical protein
MELAIDEEEKISYPSTSAGGNDKRYMYGEQN